MLKSSPISVVENLKLIQLKMSEYEEELQSRDAVVNILRANNKKLKKCIELSKVMCESVSLIATPYLFDDVNQDIVGGSKPEKRENRFRSFLH